MQGEEPTQQHAPGPEPPPGPAPTWHQQAPPWAPGMWGGARMPVPGNAEWGLWFLVEVVFAIIWAASDSFGASDFVAATTALTAAYLISRGIAKAGKVLEH